MTRATVRDAETVLATIVTELVDPPRPSQSRIEIVEHMLRDRDLERIGLPDPAGPLHRFCSHSAFAQGMSAGGCRKSPARSASFASIRAGQYVLPHTDARPFSSHAA
jgi:hypothetical protein